MTHCSRQASLIAPALQNWWILMCHNMKMCHERGKNGNARIQKDEKRKWSTSEPPIYQRRFKVGRREVSKNAHVLQVPCTCASKTSSAESITSLSRAVFFGACKEKKHKITAAVFLVHFLSSCIWEQLSKGKRLFLFLPLKTRQGPGRECIVQWSKAFPAVNEDQNPSCRLNY